MCSKTVNIFIRTKLMRTISNFHNSVCLIIIIQHIHSIEEQVERCSVLTKKINTLYVHNTIVLYQQNTIKTIFTS